MCFESFEKPNSKYLDVFRPLGQGNNNKESTAESENSGKIHPGFLIKQMIERVFVRTALEGEFKDSKAVFGVESWDFFFFRGFGVASVFLWRFLDIFWCASWYFLDVCSVNTWAGCLIFLSRSAGFLWCELMHRQLDSCIFFCFSNLRVKSVSLKVFCFRFLAFLRVF